MPEDAVSRTAFLKERLAAAQGGPTGSVPFRQTQIDLVKIEVPIDFPLYRLQSGRTHRAQARWVEEHNLAADFFADPESEETQVAQHHILSAMIDEEDLREDLVKRDQREPIVLTSDGFIVDGNRRTSALRTEGEVEHLVAVVLPGDAQAEDFYRTELELQMARQTKAEYNWIDQALHVRMGRDEYQEDLPAIADRMNEKPAEVERMLARLALADLYLDWLGEAGKYHRIPVTDQSAEEQSFIDLEARERRPKFATLTAHQQRAIRNSCFALIHESQGYQLVRQLSDDLLERPAEVVTRLKPELPDELGEQLVTPIETDTTDGDEDLLDELVDADGGGPGAGSELLNVVSDPTHVEDVVPAFKQVLDDLAELDSEQREQREPLRNVERALRALQAVELDAETKELPAIATALSGVSERAEDLSDQVEQLRQGG